MKRITYREAEKLLGGRVDRRCAYYFEDSADALQMFGGGPVFIYGEWTKSCSGCFETEDGHPVGKYPWDEKANCHIGGGCSECGYTGKRRDGFYVPVYAKEKRRPLEEIAAEAACGRDYFDSGLDD